ncbi:septum formation inhibitor Maf [Pseudoclavibacter chungangensis]|uniref:Nucleoside triphosphate pyrophosphatase n=1 Tax=Pseudoclavibacter chungangensis TaxID=587635 RepID=A0A7J5BYS5_9MICO|nr:nucleoside triphosphate pyrophosphatase [Pseudoclavibacter chungangensis]KAB1659458.1 septum formation inhibitor Maf [Pseudoclavibacter chungangensis]NYJ67689.1 septum formation protein [Pseudoclavibacter chungangensis]
MRLYLASTSPARLALLRAAGVDPVVLPSHVDEDAVLAREAASRGVDVDALEPQEVVQLLARAKAIAVADDPDALDPDTGGPLDGFVLGGDSMFEFAGRVLGKPHEPAVARARWLEQRGGTGTLWSGHWLVDRRAGAGGPGIGRPAHARVTFVADLDDAEIDAYIASREPLEVAGAFTIDSLGGPFIERIEGDPSTVVGLSLPTVRRLVRESGGEWFHLWRGAATLP